MVFNGTLNRMSARVSDLILGRELKLLDCLTNHSQGGDLGETKNDIANSKIGYCFFIWKWAEKSKAFKNQRLKAMVTDFRK